MRFEAGERRYNRMKGLVRAALEKVHCIEKENKDLRTAGLLGGFGLQPLHFNSLLSVFVGKRVKDDDVLKSSVESLVLELNKVRGDNSRLVELNRVLRGVEHRDVIHYEDPMLKAMYMDAISQAKEFKPMISKLQAQISAMEFDWTQAKQMRDELFDYEEKLREQEMVADAMCLKPVRPEGVKVFATSRRHMLEILVDDRNRNINGYFSRRVVPLEKLRAQKDAEILELRKTICRYEVQFGIISVEVDRVKLDKITSDVCIAEAVHKSLMSNCNGLEARIESLQHTVKEFEDRVREWSTAHEQATAMIEKAERLRSEYDGMMAALRKENDRILAKKRELEKRSSVDVHKHFDRMSDISEQVDGVEGEIAANEIALERLKALKAKKDKLLAAEQKMLDELELEINGVVGQRMEFESFLVQKKQGPDVMDADGLAAEFSSVRV
jgi:chromosome segregation ATPase